MVTAVMGVSLCCSGSSWITADSIQLQTHTHTHTHSFRGQTSIRNICQQISALQRLWPTEDNLDY